MKCGSKARDCGRRAFQAEGTARAEALRQECAWCLQTRGGKGQQRLSVCSKGKRENPLGRVK